MMKILLTIMLISSFPLYAMDMSRSEAWYADVKDEYLSLSEVQRDKMEYTCSDYVKDANATDELANARHTNKFTKAAQLADLFTHVKTGLNTDEIYQLLGKALGQERLDEHASSLGGSILFTCEYSRGKDSQTITSILMWDALGLYVDMGLDTKGDVTKSVKEYREIWK